MVLIINPTKFTHRRLKRFFKKRVPQGIVREEPTSMNPVLDLSDESTRPDVIVGKGEIKRAIRQHLKADRRMTTALQRY